MTRSEADAAEITQDTFLSAYQHLERLPGRGGLRQLGAPHRGQQRADAAAPPEGPGQRRARSSPGPEFTERGSLAEYARADWSSRADDKALDAELGRAIQQATDALPEGYREVFLLKDVEGLSYEEIAEIMGISVPAVKSRLHRARLALREAIDAFYKEV